MTRKGINQVSRIKVITTVFVAVLAFSALGSAAASADWFVGGVKLTGSAALSTQALVDAPPTLLVPALGLSIVCSGHLLDLANPRIIAGDKDFASSLRFLSCNTTVPAKGCALQEVNQPIATNAVLSRAFLGVGEEDRVLFAPETKGVFTEFSFSESNTCAFNGVEVVKGELIAGAPTGQLELLRQSLTGLGSTENNSLEIGAGNKAFLDGGRVLLTLASDSTWSFK